MADALGPCPRCDPTSVLVPREGAFHESICPRCLGRYLPVEARELALSELQVDDAMLRDMVRTFAGERLVCPGCRFKTSQVRLRGRSAAMCTGCGGMWLDQGDLSRVTGERHREVGVTDRADDELPARPPPKMPDGPPKVARGYRAVQGALFAGWVVLMLLLKLKLDAWGTPAGTRLLYAAFVSSAYLVWFTPTLVARRKQRFLQLFGANVAALLLPPLWLYVAVRSVIDPGLEERTLTAVASPRRALSSRTSAPAGRGG